MKRIIRISAEDLETSEQNALELFYSGIKSKETRRDNLTWDCVFPIYQVGDEYKIELSKSDNGVVCGDMHVYKGTPEEYYALISIEACRIIVIGTAVAIIE